MMRVKLIVLSSIVAVFSDCEAQQLVGGNVQVVSAPQVANAQVAPPQQVTINNVQPVPGQRSLVVVPVLQKPAETQPDGAGRVTEIRDEHVKVIDGKLEIVDRTIRQTESRLVERHPPENKANAATVAIAVQQPPSLEPPILESAESRRLIHYFCRCWKNEDYARMWWAMSPRYRLKAKYEEFRAVFTQDAKANGGLLDESIGSNEKHDDWGATLNVELRFKLRRVQPRKVEVKCERMQDGMYRIAESGIIPVDMNNL